jgi:integrase
VRTTSKENGTIILSDAVTLEFSKLLQLTGLKKPGVSFYSLRHVHRTIADNAKDQPAADHIMGHSDGSIDEEYRERIDDDRLRAVINVVHAWFWPKPKAEPANASTETEPTILPFKATAS